MAVFGTPLRLQLVGQRVEPGGKDVEEPEEQIDAAAWLALAAASSTLLAAAT